MSYYLLVSGCEIVFTGTKKDCITKFNEYINPFPMQLLKGESVKILNKGETQ